jgi:hypothetical protein
VQVTEPKSKIPTHAGLWLRTNVPGNEDEVVRVYANVILHGVVHPLSWCVGDNEVWRWLPVEDDGHWGREVRADDVSAGEVVELKARVEVAEASMRAAQARAASAYVEAQRRHVHEATELRAEADRLNAALEAAKAENTAWRAFATSVASTLHTQGAPSMFGLKAENLPELLDTYLAYRWQRKTKQQEGGE